jgi:hypothetical protein
VKAPHPGRFWNWIRDQEKEQIVVIALVQLEQSPRKQACSITDTEGYFILGSSVYRILISFDSVPSPSYMLMSASDSFHHQTVKVHKLRQTNRAYFWLSAGDSITSLRILDDYSWYIIARKFYTTVDTTDVNLRKYYFPGNSNKRSLVSANMITTYVTTTHWIMSHQQM